MFKMFVSIYLICLICNSLYINQFIINPSPNYRLPTVHLPKLFKTELSKQNDI